MDKKSKYDEDYLIGYRLSHRRGKRGDKNPFDYEKERAKWDGFFASQTDISKLADEQS